jgi:predicted nucleotidyltransferase
MNKQVILTQLTGRMEELLGTGVDLVTDKALRPQVRRTIEQEMVDVA